MARMNISIPDELKARMETVAADDSNWSRIAAAAFEDEVARKERLAGLTGVKARLAAEQDEDEARVKARGREAGVAWARDRARPIMLRRLQRAVERLDGENWPSGAYLAEAISGDTHSTLGDILGFDEPDEIEIEFGWLDGFVEGAMEVFEAD